MPLQLTFDGCIWMVYWRFQAQGKKKRKEGKILSQHSNAWFSNVSTPSQPQKHIKQAWIKSPPQFRVCCSGVAPCSVRPVWPFISSNQMCLHAAWIWARWARSMRRLASWNLNSPFATCHPKYWWIHQTIGLGFEFNQPLVATRVALIEINGGCGEVIDRFRSFRTRDGGLGIFNDDLFAKGIDKMFRATWDFYAICGSCSWTSPYHQYYIATNRRWWRWSWRNFAQSLLHPVPKARASALPDSSIGTNSWKFHDPTSAASHLSCS